MKAIGTTAILLHDFPNNPSNNHHQAMAQHQHQAMAQHQLQDPFGRQSNVSTANSAVGLFTHTKDQSPARREHQSEKKPLYDDLRSYITRKRHHWLATRDVELAYPLQQRFFTYEAEVMQDIHEIEHEREIKHRQRAREMNGAAGIAKLSWKLYKLKMKVCGRWRKHRLHGIWKHGRLNAKKKELSAEFVRLQTSKRLEVIREVLWYANEESVEDCDDGAYVRDGILNYIVTGYDSMFPIARNLEVDFNRS